MVVIPYLIMISVMWHNKLQNCRSMHNNPLHFLSATVTYNAQALQIEKCEGIKFRV